MCHWVEIIFFTYYCSAGVLCDLKNTLDVDFRLIAARCIRQVYLTDAAHVYLVDEFRI